MVLKGLKPKDQEGLILNINRRVNIIDHPDVTNSMKLGMIDVLVRNIDIFRENETVQNMKRPKNLKELRVFLRLTGQNIIE